MLIGRGLNCSEVGEHIDKQYANILIENAKRLSNKYIIFTWSSHGGEHERHCDPHHQHLNPLSRDKYIELMKCMFFLFGGGMPGPTRCPVAFVSVSKPIVTPMPQTST